MGSNRKMNDINNHSQNLVKESRSQNSSPRKTDSIKHGRTLYSFKELFKLGYQRAISSGKTESDEKDIETLSHHAAAMAKETYCEKYSPDKLSHDGLREKEFQHLLTEREGAEKASKFASIEVKEKDAEASQLSIDTEKPRAQSWIMWTATLVLSLTLAPAFHDFVFFTLFDDLLNWLFSLIAGCSIGAFLAYSIGNNVEADEGKKLLRLGGLIGGITIAVGLGILRLAGSEEFGGKILAVGFTLIEVGIILVLELVGKGVRKKYQNWLPLFETYNKALAALDAAKKELTRRLQKIDEINLAINDHISYVEQRNTNNKRVEEIEAVAVRSVVDGYSQGLAENAGRLLGVKGGQNE